MAGRLGWFLASKIAKIAKMDGRKRFLASKIAKIVKMDGRWSEKCGVKVLAFLMMLVYT